MRNMQIKPVLKSIVSSAMLLAMLLSLGNTTALACQDKVAAQDDVKPAEVSAEEVKPLEGAAREQAALLVRQLANPDFEVRQQASRELWKIGPPVLKLLEIAMDGGASSEAKMRSRDLATLIRIGVKHDAEADVVRCIVGFLDREARVQDRAIQKLVHLQQTKVALKLIDLVPSEKDKKRLRELCSIDASEAELALRLGNYPEFRKFINNPATRDTKKLVFYYYLWIEDKLDPELERLQVEAEAEIKEAVAHKVKRDKELAKEKAKAKGKKKTAKKEVKKPEETIKQPSLTTLIGLLRFIGRWDEATEWAKKVYDRKLRRQLVHTILMESGNWKGLAELIVEPESDDAGDEDEADIKHDGLAYPSEGYKTALVNYYAGNDEKFEAAVSEIEEGIAKELKKQKQRGNKPQQGNSKHATFLRYALDFEGSLKYTPLERNPATFQMLSKYKRYEKLFEVFNLGTFEKRAKYFKGRSRHIRSLQKRVEYYVEQKDKEQRDVYTEKRDSEIQNWLNVVGLLGTLGLDEEAELYYRQMFFEFSENVTTVAQNAVTSLKDMGAYESAWEIAELENERTRSFNCLAALLNPTGYTHEAAQFLDATLAKKIKDPIERYRKIAALIKSPANLSDEKIDFWKEIGEIDLSQSANIARHLFMIWNLEEEQLFERATSYNEEQLTERLMKNGDYLLAAQKFEALALSQSSPVYYAKAWYAYTKDNNADKAWQTRLQFVLNFQPGNPYSYTSGYVGTHWQSLPFDAFRLHDCLTNTTVGNNCYYLWQMAANDSEAVLSAHQKMVRTQILRLRYIDSPYFHQSENDHPRFIEGCLESGDVEGARRWFEKLSSFEPANSGFVENNFPSMEKMGRKEFVDEMFQIVSDDFYEILKSFPDSAMYLNNYAWSCANAKRNVKNGIELSKRAVKLRPGLAGYYDTLAELYHVDGQNDMAIETIRKAIEINPMRNYYSEQLKKFKEASAKAAEPDPGS